LKNEEDKEETLRDLLESEDTNANLMSNLHSSILTGLNSSNQSINDQIKITISPHVDVHQVTRSKMFIRLDYDYVKVDDL